MELGKLKEAAENAFAYMRNVEFFIVNNFEWVDIEKECICLFHELNKVRDELINWKSDYKNKGLIDTLKTANVADLPKCFYSLCDEVGNKPIQQGVRIKYNDTFCVKKCRAVCEEISQELKERFKIAEPQQLPKELETEEATRYFTKAIELGLMNDNYEWSKGLQMLSLFAREMSLRLKLSKATNADGTGRIAWKPFEQLFNIEKNKLRSNFNDIQKTGIEPKEKDLIDKVFE